MANSGLFAENRRTGDIAMGKVLVTGGGGFIGEKVVEELLEKGREVRTFDLIKPLVKSERFTHFQGSILDPYELSRAMRGCDFVIHLAAALGVQRTETNRLECLFINIQGTINILEACVKERVNKIVFSSSSEVYGDNDAQIISEDTPLQPKSNYAVSKIAGEEYLRAYYETYGLKYNVVRFFNIYGEKQKPDFVIPRFVKNVVNDIPPVIYGTGDQSRCFCYVKDAAKGIIAILLSSAYNETFNIGNDSQQASVKELALRIINLSGKSLEPKFVSYDKADRDMSREIMRRVPSIEKARKILGYDPKYSLDDGLKKMIAFYERNADRQPRECKA